jgi:MOSC domain-containing protein YiiM
MTVDGQCGHQRNYKVADIASLYREDKHNLDMIRRVVAVEALAEEWREYLQERLEKLQALIEILCKKKGR